MLEYKESFEKYIGAKKTMNEHEKQLFKRAQHYTKKLTGIPGIRMIAVANSLSMYATHEDSDIDIFIIAENGTLWWVRFWVTIILFFYGVWRHGEDIRENFCLSFFVTTDGQNMKDIAIQNDIYLFYWIFFLKPLFATKGTYREFLQKNSWVNIDKKQLQENTQFMEEIKKTNTALIRLAQWGNRFIRLLTQWKTIKRYEKLGKPEGIIVSGTMLKFHDKDRRKTIRDAILGKNFDK